MVELEKKVGVMEASRRKEEWPPGENGLPQNVVNATFWPWWWLSHGLFCDFCEGVLWSFGLFFD